MRRPMNRSILIALALALVVTAAVVVWALQGERQSTVVPTSSLAERDESQASQWQAPEVAALPPVDATRTVVGPFRCPDGPLARVDGEAILGTEFCPRLLRLAGGDSKSNGEAMQRQARMLLDQAIDARLFEKAALRAGAVVTDVQVDEALAIQLAKAPSSTAAARDLSELRTQLRTRLAQNLLVSRKVTGGVTDQEVRSEYERHPDKWGTPAAVTVEAWLVPSLSGATPEADEAARKRLTAAAEELARGEEPNGHTGGTALVKRLPFDVPQDSPEVELVQAVFSVREGQFSRPVRTRAGWLVAKVVGRKDPERRPFQDVAAQVRQALEAQRHQAAKQALLAELRQSAKIERLVSW